MKKSVFAMVSLFCSLLFFGLILWQWQKYGVVREQSETILDMSKGKSRVPQIYAVSRRVKQKEKIAISSLAKATDVDGKDMSQGLHCYNEKGHRISGFLDTSRPGKFILKWEAKSAVTGRKVVKEIIILVDGRA